MCTSYPPPTSDLDTTQGISFCMIVMCAQRTAKGGSAHAYPTRPSFRQIKIEYEKHVTVDPGVSTAPIKEVDVTDSEGSVPASRSPRRAQGDTLDREERGHDEWPMDSSPGRRQAFRLGGPV